MGFGGQIKIPLAIPVPLIHASGTGLGGILENQEFNSRGEPVVDPTARVQDVPWGAGRRFPRNNSGDGNIFECAGFKQPARRLSPNC
jgi:hypothetical protein